jgi:hypothetical protein
MHYNTTYAMGMLKGDDFASKRNFGWRKSVGLTKNEQKMGSSLDMQHLRENC